MICDKTGWHTTKTTLDPEINMKAILFTVATLFSINAMADQCQAISQAEAERAALLLQKGSVVTDYCEPCNAGKKDAKISVVNKVKLEQIKLGNQYYTEVKVNGKSIDLAYTFVQVAPNRSVNLAKAIKCETLDETSVSSVIDGNLKTIRQN